MLCVGDADWWALCVNDADWSMPCVNDGYWWVPYAGDAGDAGDAADAAWWVQCVSDNVPLYNMSVMLIDHGIQTVICTTQVIVNILYGVYYTNTCTLLCF